MAGNLLSDWDPVWTVMENFPLLEKFSVRSNRVGDVILSVPSTTATVLDRCYTKLRHLNVDENNIRDLSTLLSIGRIFPNLEELVVANNCVATARNNSATTNSSNDEGIGKSLTTDLAAAFPNLVFLDASNCSGLFQGVYGLCAAWSKLPKLQSLSLDDNLDVARFRSDNDHEIFYPSLRHLQFAGTGVTDWEDIEHFRTLSSLRFRNVPILANLSTAAACCQIVGRFPNLVQLNKSSITETERRDAARWCLRDDKHPQHEYWKEQYPEMAARIIQRDNSPTSVSVAGLHSSATVVVVNVTIRSMASSSCTVEPLIRRLPTRLTVDKLKALCARHFGLDLDLQTLHFRNDEKSTFPEPLDRDDYTLADYGVSDGAEILMNEIDVKFLEKERERQAQESVERLEKQESEAYKLSERKKLVK
jgi:Ubiquitin-like domain